MRGRSAGTRAAAVLLALLSAAAAVPRTGGTVRVYFLDVRHEPNPGLLPSASHVFLSSSVYRSLVRTGPDGFILPGIASSWTVSPGGALAGLAAEREDWSRWVFQLDPLARFPDGRRVTAEDIIDSWERLLNSSRSPYRWLLDPVVGVRAYRSGGGPRPAGLVAGFGTLEIRLNRPAPDLLHRLAHPALGISELRADDAGLVGTGPFDSDPDNPGTLIRANSFHQWGRPFLDGLELLQHQGVDPALLLQSGQADLTVLHGRAAGQILSSPNPPIRMTRLPGWDRVYSLVWNGISTGAGGRGGLPERLGSALDRRAMVRYLFDGRGEPVSSLLPLIRARAQAETVSPGQPFSGRVSLLHDDSDPSAMAIASRVKASWEELGLRVGLQPVDADELRYRLASGDYVAAVLLHHPPTVDPVLGLHGTLSQLGEVAEPAVQALDEASMHSNPVLRLQRARMAEDLLLEPGFLVPLVRVYAWLATTASLVGVQGDAAGMLYLDDAWWLPEGPDR